jgi:hypothetical protein
MKIGKINAVQTRLAKSNIPKIFAGIKEIAKMTGVVNRAKVKRIYPQ